MMRPNLLPLSRLLTPFKRACLFLLLLAGCDTFESDIAAPAVSVSDEELYVLADAETLIDLESRISANFPGTLSITGQPTHGTLQTIGEGLLRYSPDKGLSRTRDSFEFTVFASNNNVITTDTIYINVETDSTRLPCSIYPVPDYVTNVSANNTNISVDVLKNDILCGASVMVQVYRPTPDFMPRFGSVAVNGTTVVYTPGASFAGKDTLIYKVINAQKPTSFGYGFVYINRDSVCGFTLFNDVIRLDTLLQREAYHLPVFANDVLCDSLDTYDISVIAPPTHGTVSQTARGFEYRPNGRPLTVSDDFTYAVRKGNVQKTAHVKLIVEKPPMPCSFQAVQDSIDITAVSTSLIYINVLQNDQICDSLQTLKITRQPRHGTVFIDSDKRIGYNRVVMKSDSLQYEICNGKICSRASAYIKQN